MKRYPHIHVEIGGHTSAVGTIEYNQELAEKPAHAIAKIWIEEFGINESQLSSVGYGESNPKYGDSSKNRRIEAIIQVKKIVPVTE